MTNKNDNSKNYFFKFNNNKHIFENKIFIASCNNLHEKKILERSWKDIFIYTFKIRKLNNLNYNKV